MSAMEARERACAARRDRAPGGWGTHRLAIAPSVFGPRAARIALGLCVASGVALGAPGAGLAQDPVDFGQTLQGAEAEAARKHHDRAAELYRAGRPADAIAELQRAYDLRPSPKILRTMGEVAEEMRDYVVAFRAWRRVLDAVDPDVDPALWEKAQARLSFLRDHVAELQLEGGVPGAVAVIDDEPIGILPLPHPWWLSIGTHRVRVTKRGYVPFSQPVNASGGATLRLLVSLVPEPSRAEPLPPVSLEPPQPAGRARMTPLAWTGYGAALAFGAASIATGVTALTLDHEARSRTYVGSTPPPAVTQDLHEARRWGIATDVMIGAAVVTAAVTTYYTLVRRPAAQRKERQEVRAGLEPGQAWIGGEF